MKTTCAGLLELGAGPPPPPGGTREQRITMIEDGGISIRDNETGHNTDHFLMVIAFLKYTIYLLYLYST